MIESVFSRGWTLTASIGLVLLFILGNVALQPLLTSMRLDLTSSGLYSVSPATTQTLGSLSEPIELTFVYSRRVGQDYPRIRAHAARVSELLAAYESKSGGQIRLRQLDPRPFSPAEDEALAAGLTAVQTQGADPLYFGLIGRNSVDDVRTLPFLAPEQDGTLEYDLTQLVARLDNPSPAKVGVVSRLPGMRGDGVETGYRVLADLSGSFSTDRISPDFASLPEGLDALLLAYVGELTPYQAWLVEQYLMRGGRVIWLVDPAAKIAANNSIFDTTGAPTAARLGLLGRHWGVELAEGAVADAGNALPVQVMGADGRASIVGQPLFVAAKPANFSRIDPITAELTRAIHFGAPGAFFVAADSPFSMQVLVETGSAPSFIPADRAVMDLPASDVIDAYSPENGALVLAARLTGQLTTAFPGGPPNIDLTGDPVTDELIRAETASAPDHLEQGNDTSQLIIIADADFLDDGFYVNPNGEVVIADNGTFLLNSVESLTGIDGLLALRSRAAGLRLMTRVDALRSKAEAEFFEEQSRLETQLAETEDALASLEAARRRDLASGSGSLSHNDGFQDADIQALRESILQTRESLRAIERDFRRDIDGLEWVLKAVNIWGGAVLIIIFGFVMGFVRRRSQR